MIGINVLNTIQKKATVFINLHIVTITLYPKIYIWHNLIKIQPVKKHVLLENHNFFQEIFTFAK